MRWYWPGAVTGELGVSFTPGGPYAVVGFPLNFTASIIGRATANVWNFGDGTVVSNRPWTTHVWSEVGDYPVVLTAYNESNPGGVSATVIVRVSPGVHYVAMASTTPVAPYTNWATASRDIQSAVDVAEPGSLILVSNGVYATGGRTAYGTVTNRVAIDRPITVRSINGPDVTVIQGYQVPGVLSGPGAIRCAYLTNGATLSGFTLTNGGTHDSGDYYVEQGGAGVWCQSASALVSNCVMSGNMAEYYGAGACYGTLINCTLSGGLAHRRGGGASNATLTNCTLTGNAANEGGGADSCTLVSCIVSTNRGANGGGVIYGTLYNCTLAGNLASWWGGAGKYATLNNCTLVGNSSGDYGGGAFSCTLINCALTGNSSQYGGGASTATLADCTLTGNSATRAGGGAHDCNLTNCIVCFNSAGLAPTNYSGGALNFCCTTPQPAAGVGNISLDPQLASAWHLSAASPCRGAGSATYISGTDIDGEAWGTPPSIGCDEYQAGAVTGPLTVSILSPYTSVAVGFSLDVTALIAGRTTASAWNFGDGTVLSNRPYANHKWAAPGSYPVVLTAYNESNPGGVSAVVNVQVVAGTHYVAVASATPVPPYTNWATAARDIQSAVDAAEPGALVLVSNGVYAVGGRAVYGAMTNRVAIDRAMTVRSVNGPEVTVIQGWQVPGAVNGDGAIRCAYLTNGAVLSGFHPDQRRNAGLK